MTYNRTLLSDAIKSIVILTDLLDDISNTIKKVDIVAQSITHKVQAGNIQLCLMSLIAVKEIRDELENVFRQNNLNPLIYAGQTCRSVELNLENYPESDLVLEIINNSFYYEEVNNSIKSYNILFEYICPQTSLPIYWYSKKGWFPIFPNDIELEHKGPMGDQNYRQLCYELGENLEIKMQEIIIQKLKKIHGEGNGDRWWGEGAPKEVRLKCAQRWEDENRKDEPWNFLDLLDYPKIIGSNDNLKALFYFDENDPDKAPAQIAKSKGEAWFSRFNDIRKKYAHPSRTPPTLEDYEYLKKIHAWFYSNIKKQGTV